MPITPSPNRGVPPAFHELDDETFEELTCALLHKEPGIRTADRYGGARDTQYGIDVLAERLDGAGIEVASAKCYRQIKKGEIAGWSDDFLKHWDTQWKERRVRRFILVVGCAVNSAERMADIEAERARFEKLGIVYEVWAPRQLQDRLRAHPGIVSQYLGEEWVPRLCGELPRPVALTGTPDTGVLSQLVVSQLGSLQDALSAETERRLDVEVDGIRRGELHEVGTRLAELRAGPTWNQLRQTTRARVIRLQGSLRMQYGDVDGATQLLEQADAIAPAEEPRLRALLTLHRAGPLEAIKVLGEPTTRDGAHMKLSLLLEAGKVEDAAAVLDQHPLLKEPHPETERLRAFVELMSGRRRQALAAVSRAEDLEPRWPATRRAGAIVRYALALSPAVVAESVLSLNPVDLDLVRTDDEAIAFLAESARRFDALAADGADPAVRRQDAIWAMACLCNMRDKLEEAEQRVQNLLAEDRAETLAIIWALARGFTFDRGASMQALRALIDQREATSQHVLTLAILLAVDGHESEAAAVLRNGASLFDAPRAAELRDQWLSEFDAVQALAEGREPGPVTGPANLLARAVRHAQQTGNWQGVEDLFQTLMTTPSPPVLALPAARALANAGRWAALGPHIDGLLTFGTAEAVRLAIFTAHRIGQPIKVRAILDAHRGTFAHDVPPNDVRAVEAEALLAAGDPAAAIRRASQLAAESPTLADQFVKAELHIRIGNVAAALPTIREAVAQNKISGEQALRLIPVVAGQDRDLAKKLLQRARRDGIPKRFATFAMLEAIRLGVEHEMKDLLGAVEELAREGDESVRAMPLEEAVEVMRRVAQDRYHQQQQYFDGVVPVHLLAAVSGLNLARLFYLPPLDDLEPLAAPVMIRHGARRAHEPKLQAPISGFTLHIDITGLFLAHQLELLDVLETLPQPIRISSVVPQLLLQLERETRPAQPHYVKGTQAIVDAADAGTLTVVDVTDDPVGDGPAVVRNPDAIVRRYLAGAADDVVLVVYHRPTLATPGADRTTTLRGVVEGLHHAGAIDAREYERILARLGHHAGEQDTPAPTRGARLRFAENALSVLAAEEVLPALLQNYQMEIDSRFLQHARAEALEAVRNEDVAASIARLRTRLAQGAESGRYRYVPSTERPGAGATGDEDDGPGARDPMNVPIMRALLDALRLPQTPGALVWIDDRFVSGYPYQNGNLLVGVWDVLRALREAKLVDDQRYYAALLRLRAAGMSFLPIDWAEVQHHLDAAPIADGVVTETPALRTLRQYLGLVLLYDRHLKIRGVPAGPDGRPDEIQFILGIRRLAEDCIIGTWTDFAAADNTCRARARWLWDALRVDWFLLERPDLADTEPARKYLLPALQLTGLLIGTIEFRHPNMQAILQRREAYFRWLDDVVIADRLDADPVLSEKTVEQLKSVLQDQLASLTRDRPAYRGVGHRLLRLPVMQLPTSIREALLADETLCAKLNIPRISIVHAAGMTFEGRRFWKGITRALAYGSDCVRPVQNAKRVILRRVPGDEIAVRISGRGKQLLKDTAFRVFDRDPGARAAALRSQIDWFDVPRERREAIIERIVAIADPLRRLQALNEARQRSAADNYKRLLARLRRSTTQSLGHFRPPAAAALLDHLRLEPDTARPFAEQLDRAAGMLVEDHGLVTATRRLMALPVPLPNAVVDQLRRLPNAERAVALQRLTSGARTPLQLVHALRLCRTAGASADLFARSLDRCLREWPVIGSLFVAVLKWTEAAIGDDGTWMALPGQHRLATVWLHADRITDTLASLAFDHAQVARDFAHRRFPRRLADALRADPAYDCATATPDTITTETLLFHGLGYVLGPDRARDVMTVAQVDATQAILTTVDDGGTRIPSYWLLVNREAADNTLGSFLASRSDVLEPLDASARAGMELVDRMLTALETDPNIGDIWINLWGMTRPAIDKATARRLETFLGRVDLVKLVGNDPSRMFVCRMLIDIWHRCGSSEDLRPRLFEQLLGIAAAFASTTVRGGDDLQSNEVLQQLAETGLVWARSPTPEAGFARFGDFVVRLAGRWPGSNRTLRHVLSVMLGRESVIWTNHLWTAYNSLRGR